MAGLYLVDHNVRQPVDIIIEVNNYTIRRIRGLATCSHKYYTYQVYELQNRGFAERAGVALYQDTRQTCRRRRGDLQRRAYDISIHLANCP